MKPSRLPAVLLAFLCICFVFYVVYSSDQLPERVATHFNASGQADGWMSRLTHVRFTLTFGFLFSLFPVGICFVLRFLPSSLINIPNRAYWLAPERRMDSVQYLFRHSLWFACLAVCFVMGIHYSIMQANREAQPHLSTQVLVLLIGGFLAGVITWTFALLRRFAKSV